MHDSSNAVPKIAEPQTAVDPATIFRSAAAIHLRSSYMILSEIAFTSGTVVHDMWHYLVLH